MVPTCLPSPNEIQLELSKKMYSLMHFEIKLQFRIQVWSHFTCKSGEDHFYSADTRQILRIKVLLFSSLTVPFAQIFFKLGKFLGFFICPDKSKQTIIITMIAQ